MQKIITIPNIYRKRMRYIWIICLLLCTACNSETDFSASEPNPAFISWNIRSGALEGTRALMDDESLRTACTPHYSGNYESIGIWGQYSVESSGQQTIQTEFDAVPLTFAAKAIDTNPYNNWNYPGEARIWKPYAQYDFRACFPQALMTSLMTQMDATIFQGGPINTMVLQEDLLVAATHVDTESGSLDGPVPLDMKHIFSALRFKVSTADGFTTPDDESITSCWLQNQGSGTDLFSTSGYLVHSGNATPKIEWYTYESSVTPMYVWEHSGVPLVDEGVLYTSNGNRVGKEYTANDGWLLVVPQQVKAGTLHFCFTMSTTGTSVFSVAIPPITYEPGGRYTYVLEISGANVTLDLTIAEWNRLNSTHDIIL